MSFIRRPIEAFMGWPKWARIAAPVTAAFIVLGAISGGASQNDTQKSKGKITAPTPTATTEAPTTSATGHVTATTEASSTTTTTTTTSSPPSVASSGGLALLAQLRVAAEGPRTGYNRDLFPLWIDADHDGCDTRHEVLITESVVPARVGSGCTISGEWFSAYDGVTTTDASTFDIDHMVPLAEAWDSGASGWDLNRRRDYANDLGYAGSLIAVSASSNRSKGDSDPARWEPPRHDDWCQYATDWVSVKVRWDLSADQAEVNALRADLDTCNGTPSTTPVPAPTSTTTTAPPAVSGSLAVSALDCGGERVTVANAGSVPADLTGWTIHDEGTKHTFSFPVGYTLAPGGSVTVKSGGRAGPGELYWTGVNVWNNDGDTAYLVNPGDAPESTRSC